MTPSQSTDDLRLTVNEIAAAPLAERTMRIALMQATIERLQADLAARDKTIETLKKDRMPERPSERMFKSCESLGISPVTLARIYLSMYDAAMYESHPELDAARSEEKP